MAVCSLAFTSCATSRSDGEKINWIEAQRYFFRNDAKLPDGLLVIRSQEQLEPNLGMATVMGRDGRPTEIDFSKQFAVAKVMPVTDHNTKVTPVKVVKTGDKSLRVVFHVKTDKASMGYSIQPMAMIILDKQYADWTIEEGKQ